MQNLNDPRQIHLFDPWAQRFSARLYEKLRTGWQGLFHDVLLELMPAKKLAEKPKPAMKAKRKAPAKKKAPAKGVARARPSRARPGAAE